MIDMVIIFIVLGFIMVMALIIFAISFMFVINLFFGDLINRYIDIRKFRKEWVSNWDGDWRDK